MHDAPQEDLIGLEKDGRHDEKRRAALHAAWLERQDEAVVEKLMHGVKNGFRRKRSVLDDEVRDCPPENITSCHCQALI